MAWRSLWPPTADQPHEAELAVGQDHGAVGNVLHPVVALPRRRRLAETVPERPTIGKHLDLLDIDLVAASPQVLPPVRAMKGRLVRSIRGPTGHHDGNEPAGSDETGTTVEV